MTQPVTNPRKDLPCGLKVALVLDESLSITDSQLAQVRTAARGFVSALQDTGASVAISGFARSVRVIPPQPTATGANVYTQVTVSETLINAEQHAISLSDYSISTTCVDAAGRTVASGTGTESAPVKLTLDDGDNVVCTITNERVEEPSEPGGGDQGGGEVPAPPCNDLDVACGNVAGAPHLFVTKQMHAHARVGDRVPITITVKNVGHVTATQVVLHETPPAGDRIVAVGDHRSIQPDGTVVWNLGDLAPGASRTVHATLLITRTGLHTDTAVASGENADPVFDVANVRAREAVRRPRPVHRPPPKFTG